MPAKFAHLFSPEDMQHRLMHWARCPTRGYLGQDYGGWDLLQSVITRRHDAELERRVLEALDIEVPPLTGYFVKVVWESGSGHIAFFTDEGRRVELAL